MSPTRDQGNRVDTPAVREAGRELLSLALIDARNQTLQLVGHLEAQLDARAWVVPLLPEIDPPLWELGHLGWFQERWIARNMQRDRGAACDPGAPRLPSVEAQADAWWDDAQVPHDHRWSLGLADLDEVKGFLLATLETTLELLDKTREHDAALYFYRLALLHEDMHGESLAMLAQTLGLALPLDPPGPVAARPPLLIPEMLFEVGSAAGGFAFDNERERHGVRIPEFEIDAQAVNWSQFVEFVDDGGYDRAELWHADGWNWLQQQSAGSGPHVAGRAPRHVEQIGVASGAVLQTHFGSPRRMLATQPALHVSWWEADAWCRWAGRRLPAEIEWEAAAHAAARRGFRWGEVWEWTASTFRPYPGFVAGPWREYSQGAFGSHKVLRGASFGTRARMRDPKFRRFEPPGSNHIFAGFRSCAA